nr:hypothetical protein [Acidiphilium iwatense]
MPGPAADQRNPHGTAHARIGIGHGNCGRFMAGVDECNGLADCGIKDRHDMVAGQRENRLGSSPKQRSDHDIGATHDHAHTPVTLCLTILVLLHAISRTIQGSAFTTARLIRGIPHARSVSVEHNVVNVGDEPLSLLEIEITICAIF